MTDPKKILTGADITLEQWELVDDKIRRTIETGDFATGLTLVNLIGKDAEAANHHPDIVLTYPSVEVTLTSHDVGGVTSRDVELAGSVDKHVTDLGI